MLFVGTGAGSASRWIRIAGFNLQPSELAKLILVNYVAVYLANKRARARKFFSGLLPILVITAVYFVLIMLEPDFGTAVALVFSVLVVLFAGECTWASSPSWAFWLPRFGVPGHPQGVPSEETLCLLDPGPIPQIRVGT